MWDTLGEARRAGQRNPAPPLTEPTEDSTGLFPTPSPSSHHRAACRVCVGAGATSFPRIVMNLTYNPR